MVPHSVLKLPSSLATQHTLIYNWTWIHCLFSYLFFFFPPQAILSTCFSHAVFKLWVCVLTRSTRQLPSVHTALPPAWKSVNAWGASRCHSNHGLRSSRRSGGACLCDEKARQIWREPKHTQLTIALISRAIGANSSLEVWVFIVLVITENEQGSKHCSPQCTPRTCHWSIDDYF